MPPVVRTRPKTNNAPWIVAGVCIVAMGAVWYTSTKSQKEANQQDILEVKEEGSLDAGKDLEMDGDVAALAVVMDTKPEEKKENDAPDFFVRSSLDDIKMNTRMRSISLRGLCSTYSSCQSCLTNTLCSWCAQTDSKDSTHQQCIPTGMPCEDKVRRSCEIALLRTPQREICVVGDFHPVTEAGAAGTTPQSTSGAAALQDALRHWHYVVRQSEGNDKCVDLVQRDCDLKSDSRQRKAIAWTSSPDACSELRSPLLIRVPGVRKMNSDALKTVLCNSLLTRNELMKGGHQGVDFLLASDLHKWQEMSAKAGICVVDDGTDQITYSQEALRSGCYPVAIMSKNLKANLEQSVIPAKYTFKSASNFSKELPGLLRREGKGMEKYDAFLGQVDEHLLLEFRKRVRQHLQSDVHVVGIVASQQDVDHLIGFVVSTIVQLPYATIEIFLCPHYQRRDFNLSVTDALDSLLQHGVFGAVTFTDTSDSVCVGDKLSPALQIHPPSPPSYVMHVFSLNVTILLEDLVSTMATQQKQVSSGAVLLPEGVMLTEFRNSSCLEEIGHLKSFAEVAHLPCVYSDELYIQARSKFGAVQVVSTFADVEDSMERMLALMHVVSKLCALQFYTETFQLLVHPLLRCISKEYTPPVDAPITPPPATQTPPAQDLDKDEREERNERRARKEEQELRESRAKAGEDRDNSIKDKLRSSEYDRDEAAMRRSSRRRDDKDEKDEKSDKSEEDRPERRSAAKTREDKDREAERDGTNVDEEKVEKNSRKRSPDSAEKEKDASSPQRSKQRDADREEKKDEEYTSGEKKRGRDEKKEDAAQDAVEDKKAEEDKPREADNNNQADGDK